MRLIVIIAGGCWMLGEGARMVIMGLFFQTFHYAPNLFDVFFDWVPLTIFGTIFFYEGIRIFYLYRVTEQNKSVESSPAAVNNG